MLKTIKILTKFGMGLFSLLFVSNISSKNTKSTSKVKNESFFKFKTRSAEEITKDRSSAYEYLA